MSVLGGKEIDDAHSVWDTSMVSILAQASLQFTFPRIGGHSVLHGIAQSKFAGKCRNLRVLKRKEQVEKHPRRVRA